MPIYQSLDFQANSQIEKPKLPHGDGVCGLRDIPVDSANYQKLDSQNDQEPCFQGEKKLPKGEGVPRLARGASLTVATVVEVVWKV